MKKATALALLVLALLLSVLFAALYYTDPQSSFFWVYSEVVLDESIAVLLVVVLLAPIFKKSFASVLTRKVHLAIPLRILALLAFAVGALVFAFWATVDLLGGYGGPGYTFSTYPFIKSLYDAIAFHPFSSWDQQGVSGFVSFGVAILGFVALRINRGIGVAVRQGVAYFAAPVLVVFELALWNAAPADMFWHVTTFAPYSLGSYATPEEFSALTNAPSVIWGGNVYWLSNWFVLLAATGLFALGILTRRRSSHKPFRRVQ